MTNDQIKHMAERFLSWRLPENFNPDGGISVARPNYAETVPWVLTGTNLFDYEQAKTMVQHMVEGMPAVDAVSAKGELAIIQHRLNQILEEVPMVAKHQYIMNDLIQRCTDGVEALGGE